MDASSPFHHELTHDPEKPSASSTVTKNILARHSTRVFITDKPVPRSILEECLSLSQHAPSSTNMQPWRLTFTQGPRLDRLRTAMTNAATSGVPSSRPPVPKSYQHFRSEIGHALYGPEGYGIAADDREGSKELVLRNFTFFDAPCIATVGYFKELADADVLSVGMYLQTLVLLLTDRGLGTCVLVSAAGYPQVLQEELGIHKDISIICVLAIGYEDEKEHVNALKVAREAWTDNVNFVE